MYSDEKLNCISHFIGTLLSLMALGALLGISIQSGDPWMVVSFSVFGLTMVLLYSISTLYHSTAPGELKRLLRHFDHVSIYLLICGTYTPYMLVSLRDGNGLIILAVVWALALMGILTEIYLPSRQLRLGQVLSYLALGYACIYDLEALQQTLAENGYRWLVAGGCIYSAGVLFYLLDKMQRLKHAHGIWHLFVLAGTSCHFISIIGYVR